MRSSILFFTLLACLATPVAGGQEKSQMLGDAFEAAATDTNLSVYDAEKAVGVTGGADGVHLTLEEHHALGEALAAQVLSLLAPNN